MSTERKFLAPNPEAVRIALLSMLQSRTAWDEPPELGFIYNDDDGMVRTSALDVPEAMWEAAGHPRDLLRDMARFLRAPQGTDEQFFSQMMRSMAPETLCGIYLRSEGWTLPEKLLLEYHDSGRAMPEFHKHPQRIEMRTAAAVDSAGWAYFSDQRRNEQGTASTYENELAAANMHLGGGMFQALRVIMELVTPGARRRPAPAKGYVPPTFLNTGPRG